MGPRLRSQSSSRGWPWQPGVRVGGNGRAEVSIACPCGVTQHRPACCVVSVFDSARDPFGRVDNAYTASRFNAPGTGAFAEGKYQQGPALLVRSAYPLSRR